MTPKLSVSNPVREKWVKCLLRLTNERCGRDIWSISKRKRDGEVESARERYKITSWETRRKQLFQRMYKKPHQNLVVYLLAISVDWEFRKGVLGTSFL